MRDPRPVSGTARVSQVREGLRRLEDGLSVLREAIELSRVDRSRAPLDPDATARLFAAHVDDAIAAVRREIQYIDGTPKIRRSVRRSLGLAVARCRRWFYLLRTRRKFLDGE